MMKRLWLCLNLSLILVILTGCVRANNSAATIPAVSSNNPTPTSTVWAVPTHNPALPIISPTPDIPRQLPPIRTETIVYSVQPGDTLAAIAQKYTLPLNTVIEYNQIDNPDLLEINQILTLPPPILAKQGESFKILPDSEIVRSPSALGFDVSNFAVATNSYLQHYTEIVGEIELSGVQIIEQVSREFSVHPRVLLAWLEYMGNCISNQNPTSIQKDYPAGYINPAYKGLYLQMAWAANNLNMGYYLWKANAVSAWILTDDSVLPPDPTINAGTAAIQHVASLVFDQSSWRNAVGESGFNTIFLRYFGYAFEYQIVDLIPANLNQPAMQLPFENGAIWSFTGGPHGGWGAGSAWAALDFAPPGNALGCVQNDAWVTAAASGIITRSENGIVVIDLDGDGLEETGWTILYLHIETRDRIPVNFTVNAGDQIGHASCEGGVSSGTHVHIARKYNGEWIPADQNLPFNLDNWVSQGTGIEYNGYLVNNGKIIEAWNSRTEENQIQR